MRLLALLLLCLCATLPHLASSAPWHHANPREPISPAAQASSVGALFARNADAYEDLGKEGQSALYDDDDDLRWRNDPRQWHQQMARIVDHRFLTFDLFEAFATDAKKVPVLVDCGQGHNPRHNHTTQPQHPVCLILCHLRPAFA